MLLRDKKQCRHLMFLPFWFLNEMVLTVPTNVPEGPSSVLANRPRVAELSVPRLPSDPSVKAETQKKKGSQQTAVELVAKTPLRCDWLALGSGPCLSRNPWHWMSPLGKF